MSVLDFGSDGQLADIANFNLQILRGVFDAYLETNATILRHNIAVIKTLFGGDLSSVDPEKLAHLPALGLLIAPVAMPAFTTTSRGAATTYWRKTSGGDFKLSIGTTIGGSAGIAFSSETARQQSDLWGCEITWQPGDIKAFLDAFKALGIPDFEDKLSALMNPEGGNDSE